MPTIPNREVRFSGHSDDCFEIDGAVREEVQEPAEFQIEDPAGQRLNICGAYDPRGTGTWMFGLAPSEEGDAWPSWPIDWRMAKNGYSPEVVMQLPVGTTITQVYPQPKKCDGCERPHGPLRLVVKE